MVREGEMVRKNEDGYGGWWIVVGCNCFIDFALRWLGW
jgi:hypothetical protein